MGEQNWLAAVPPELFNLILIWLCTVDPLRIAAVAKSCKVLRHAVEQQASARVLSLYCMRRWDSSLDRYQQHFDVRKREFWLDLNRRNVKWLRGDVKFQFYEEPLDLLFGATSMDCSREFLVYGSEDTHALVSKGIVDCLVIRDTQTMKVRDVRLNHKPTQVLLCKDKLVTIERLGRGSRIRLLQAMGPVYPSMPISRKRKSCLNRNRVLNEYHLFIRGRVRRQPLAMFRARLVSTRLPLDPSTLRPNILRSTGSRHQPVSPIKIRRRRSLLRPPNLHVLHAKERSVPDIANVELEAEHIFSVLYDALTNVVVTISASGAKCWNLDTFECLGCALGYGWTTAILSGGCLIVAAGTFDDQALHSFSFPTLQHMSSYSIRCGLIRALAKHRNLPDPGTSLMWSAESLSASLNHVVTNFGYDDVFIVVQRPQLSTSGWNLKWVLDDRGAFGFGRRCAGLRSPKSCMQDRFLFTSSLFTGIVNMWDLQEGILLRRLSEACGPEVGPYRQQELVTSITDMRMSPDGSRLFVVAFGGTLYEWDLGDSTSQPTYSDRLRVSRAALGHWRGR